MYYYEESPLNFPSKDTGTCQAVLFLPFTVPLPSFSWISSFPHYFLIFSSPSFVSCVSFSIHSCFCLHSFLLNFLSASFCFRVSLSSDQSCFSLLILLSLQTSHFKKNTLLRTINFYFFVSHSTQFGFISWLLSCVSFIFLLSTRPNLDGVPNLYDLWVMNYFFYPTSTFPHKRRWKPLVKLLLFSWKVFKPITSLPPVLPVKAKTHHLNSLRI